MRGRPSDSSNVPAICVSLTAVRMPPRRIGTDAASRRMPSAPRNSVVARRSCPAPTHGGDEPSLDAYELERERIGERSVLVSLLGERQRGAVQLERVGDEYAR